MRGAKELYSGLYNLYISVYYKSMNATHLDSSAGFDQRTACGQSLHGWTNISRRTPIQATTVKHEVTCKRCLRAMGA